MFKESREYKGRPIRTRELFDIAWKYLVHYGTSKIAALYAQDFQNILDKMADNACLKVCWKKSVLIISKLYRTAIGWRVVDANLAYCPESRRTQISGTRDFHGRTGDADPEPKEHAHRADDNCSSGLRSAYIMSCCTSKHRSFSPHGIRCLSDRAAARPRPDATAIISHSRLLAFRFLNMRMPPLWKTVRSFPMEKAVSGMKELA